MADITDRAAFPGRPSREAFLRIACVAVALASLVCTNAVFANRGGPPPARDGSMSTSCRACHGNALGNGAVQILGFPAAYQADATYNISVRITDAAQLGAGFQASVQTATGQPAGTIIRTDLSNTQLNLQNVPTIWRGINHTSAGVNNAVANWSSLENSATFNFQWRAPPSDLGSVTAWAAGNAINNNFTNGGDNIYLTNVTAAFGGFPSGACCNESNGVCADNQPQDVCFGSGFRFGGADSTCATLSPPCTEATGACCDDSTGNCTDGQLRADCEATGSRFGGGNSTCATIDPPCLTPTGACCDGNTGLCADGVVEGACVGDQRTWTVAMLCANFDPPCAEHTGACCDLVSGMCEDNIAGSGCADAQQVWTKATACNLVACEALTGACCNHDPFGGCTDDATLSQCTCSTCEWSKGGVCSELECTITSVPTVGEWGFVILTLFLLIAAKLSFNVRLRFLQNTF